MKKLSIVGIILLLGVSSAFAHNGSLGIYTSRAAGDCDANVAPFTPTTLSIMYFRSSGGPNGITGAEFRVDNSNPAQVLVQSVTFRPEVATVGDISTGIGIGFACAGAGESLVWIADFTIFSLGAAPGWVFKILGDPSSQEGDGLNVSICDVNRTMQPVLGGWFIATEGACNTGTESRSWGAIKSLYDK